MGESARANNALPSSGFWLLRCVCVWSFISPIPQLFIVIVVVVVVSVIIVDSTNFTSWSPLCRR